MNFLRRGVSSVGRVPGWAGGLFGLACLLTLFLAAGCDQGAGPDLGANQSLVEIGEQSLEEAEELEYGGRDAEANTAYKRALWAFKYHERLTGEEPFLLDDALDGIGRTGGR